jgi:hypothetical protein
VLTGIAATVATAATATGSAAGTATVAGRRASPVRGSYFFELRDRLERVLDPDSGRRHRLVERRVVLVDRGVQLFHARELRQVALVELQHVRHLGQLDPVTLQVLLEVLERFDVRTEHLFLRVGDEHDAIDALQHELAGLVVEDLARHGVELHAGLHPADLAQIHRQEVEEQRAVGLGGQGEHLALDALAQVLVDELEVRRLAAQAGTVVDDLGRQLLGRVVEQYHPKVP